MEQESAADQSVSSADRCAIIADEIRGLSDDVFGSLLKVLQEVGKSNEGDVYATAKKYLQDHGFLLPDMGFVGLADRFVKGKNDEYHVCPADLLVYSVTYNFKTDDVLLAFYLTKGSIGFYHSRVMGFDPRGSMEVLDLDDEKTYWISSNRIFGKLVKVIQFGDPEWHELIGQVTTKKYLIDRVSHWIKRLGDSEYPDKERRIDELERRRAILTVDQP